MIMMDDVRRFGNAASKNCFVQLVDGHDLELMEREAESVRALSGSSDWCIAAIPVSDWNQDLTPWEADPVFGRQRFGDDAPGTLRALLAFIEPDCRTFLCGYSLAGFFALWAAYQTEAFSGVVAASPSVWYPGWIPYAEKNRIRASAVYLSLGDREEKTRNPVMATVGNAVRRQYELLASAGKESVLEWNPGNHFVDSEKRTAKGIAWILKTMDGERV